MQQTQWGPPTAGIATSAIVGIIMLIGAVSVVTDPPGRILLGVAAVGLLAFAILSWRARPKLAISDGELRIRTWFGSRTLTRDEVVKIRITEFRRIGRKVRLLEIDGPDDQLLVFTRWDLGTDPIDVLDALTAAGFTRR